MDEILVHISAPATRKDDDLYRSLADAYVNFEPHRRTPAAVQDDRGVLEDNTLSASMVTPVSSFGISSNNALRTSDSNESRECYGSFPSHISSDNHAKALERSHFQQSFEEATQPDSLLPISRLGQLERIQADWLKRKDPRLTVLDQRRSCIRSFIASTDLDTTFIDDSQMAAQAIESQLYEQGSATSEDTSEDESMAELYPEPQRPSHPVEPTPSSRSSMSSHKTDEAPYSDAEVASMLHSTQANTPSAINDIHDSIDGPSSLPDFLDFRKLPSEVFPPTPKISIETPDTLPSQITMHLRAIQKQNSERFKPSKTARTLELDERGYWLVESAMWPKKIQYEFWSSLCKYVKGGRFGWGVTLFRDSSILPTAESQATNELGPIRLYCWGEIVEHIWLSLWLCSKGKVAGSGAKWFDAGDKVVIRVL